MPTPDRRSRIATSFLVLLAAVSIWLSLGTLAVTGGDTTRIAALPSIWILVVLAVASAAAAWLVRLRVDEAWPLAISLVLWLPFVPGPIPDAFLIFQGPIEAVVWAVVSAGLVIARPSLVPRVALDPRIAPWLAASLLAIASLGVFSQVRSVVPGGDEPHYLAATQSLLNDGDLRVANNYARGDYLDYFGGRLEPHYLKRSKRGEIYSIHAPGVSVIVLPAFAIAGYRGAVATLILIAALTAALTWRAAFRVSGSAASAWVAVAAVFATTPCFFHTFTIYPEIIGGLLVMIGVWLLIELDEAREVGIAALLGTGIALSVLPWLHSRFAIIAAALGLIIVARLWRRSDAMVRIGAFLAAPVIAAAAWFSFFYVIWGSPSPTAPYGADTSTSASYILRGLIGLLFDQQFGMLTTAPVYLVAAAGSFALFKRRSRLMIELALIAIPYAITVASYQMWWAGNAAPARFLVAVLPLAALPIAMVGTNVITIASLAVSVALTVPRGIVDSGRLIFNNRGAVDAMIEWITRSVDLSLALPSVHRDGGPIALRDGLLWIVVFAAAVLVAGLFVQRRAAAVRYAATAIASALAVIVASTIVWALHGQAVLTPDRSKLAAFAAYRPSWMVARAEFLDRLSIELRGPSRLNRVPAGDYEIRPQGRVRASVGRNDPPIVELDQPQRIQLPVPVRTLNLSGPVTLRPVAVVAPASRRYAIHATRYGQARAFFFDEQAYPEKDGFWTRANGSTLVVIDVAEPSPQLPLSVTAAAAATTLRLSIGHWQHALSLQPGQQQAVLLPADRHPSWPLRIHSGDGVRPSERDPGSTDVRKLAAWVTIR